MTEMIIRELEQQLTQAEKNGDAIALGSLLAENFHGVNLRGEKLDKNGFINALTKSGIHFESLSIQALDIHLSGQFASVIGESQFTFQIGSQTISASARFLDIWSQQPAGWVLTASSVTPRKSS